MKSLKNITYKDLWTGDFDKDGIPNIDDTRPFNKNIKRRVNAEVSISEKFKQVNMRRKSYVKDLPQLEKKIGGKGGRVKGIYSTIGKQMGRNIEFVQDMGGTRILTTSKKENRANVNRIKKLFPKCRRKTKKDCILEVDNKYPSLKKKRDLPYLGYHINLRHNGRPYEIQIKCKKMQKIQDTVHPLYKAGKKDEINKRFRGSVLRLHKSGC